MEASTAEPRADGPTKSEILSWIGSRARSEGGSAVGRIADAYATGNQLEWMLLKRRDTHHCMVPVESTVASRDSVLLPFSAEVIESAPPVDPGEKITAATLRAAREHFAAKSAD